MKLIIPVLVVLLLSSCSSVKKEPKYLPVKNGDVNIAYTIKGTGDTAIVLVHGWAINKEYWTAQQDLLNNRFTTIAIDLGGHGQSGTNRNTWTINDYASDVTAVINALKLDNIILVGHSMSGDVVTAVANGIPDKIIGLVGIDNFKGVTTSYSKETQAQIDSFMTSLHSNYKAVITDYGYAALFPPKYTDSASMKKVISDILKTDTAVLIKTMQSIIQSELTAGERLSKLKIPVHVISSNYVPVNKAQMDSVCVAGFKEKIIKGVGHYPMIENTAEFNRLLVETINDISSGK